MMLRSLAGFVVIIAAVSSGAAIRAQDLPPSCHLRLINGELVDNNGVPNSDASGGSLCAQGGSAAVQLEVRQSTIAAVLSALFGAYKASYRSAVALNENRDGTYQGSLGHVISRVLDGYNYVIKRENSNLEVIVFNQKGKQAVTGPIVTEASRTEASRTEANHNRVAAQVSRVR